jgi:hypothetical protein
MNMRYTVMTAAFVVAVAFCRGAEAQDNDKSKDNGNFSAGITMGEHAEAKDLGLPIYPGSTPHKDNNDESSGANFGIFGGNVGFKLAVVKMETKEAPEKVAAYYRKALKKYGTVLDCTSAAAPTQAEKDAAEKSGTLTCDDDKAKPGEMLYKAGTKSQQHIVSVQPAEAGTTGSIYNLVYVSTKGLDGKK